MRISRFTHFVLFYFLLYFLVFPFQTNTISSENDKLLDTIQTLKKSLVNSSFKIDKIENNRLLDILNIFDMLEDKIEHDIHGNRNQVFKEIIDALCKTGAFIQAFPYIFFSEPNDILVSFSKIFVDFQPIEIPNTIFAVVPFRIFESNWDRKIAVFGYFPTNQLKTIFINQKEIELKKVSIYRSTIKIELPEEIKLEESSYIEIKIKFQSNSEFHQKIFYSTNKFPSEWINETRTQINVDDNGRIGIGTKQPDYKLQVTSQVSDGIKIEIDNQNLNFSPLLTFSARENRRFTLAYYPQHDALVFDNWNMFLTKLGEPEKESSTGEKYKDARLVIGTYDGKGDLSDYYRAGNRRLYIKGNGLDIARFEGYDSNLKKYKWIDFDANGGMMTSSNSFVIRTTDTSHHDAIIISTAGNVEICENLNVKKLIHLKGNVLHADYVFEPQFKLLTITNHANMMWAKKHLPAIPKKSIDNDGKETVEISQQLKGIVEELEIAHIYIEQLQKQIEELKKEINSLKIK